MLRTHARLHGTLALVCSLLLAACGSVGTDPTNSADPVAPSIVSQPESQSALVGTTVNFSVVATGSEPLTYQWKKNGSAIAGATAPSYGQMAAPEDDGATFAVVVSNPAGSIESAAAQLTVSATPLAPTISAQPADQTITAGQSATFNVTASGTAPLSYQWQKNGGAITGANAASYTTPAASSADSGATFAVVVSNSVGNVTSRAAMLTVMATAVAPGITTQPANQSVQAGQSATFSVVATGSAPLTYQWRRNGAAISGATGALYNTPVTNSADNGAVYAVVVSNAVGSITSANATLTVTAAPSAPKITTQPANQSVQAGQSASFSVVATGSAPLTYQWRRNGAAISGATGALYNTPATSSADNGAVFSVVVSNTVGSITSANATLTVTAAVQGTDIVTYKNDAARTGQNLTEKRLTPTNVNSTTFGKLHFLATDGKVDAQPLYLSGLNIGGVTHNVVFIATENDSVYAFDADTGTQLWKVSLIPAGEKVSDVYPAYCSGLAPSVGVTATPVINRATGTIYVIAMTVSSDGTTYHHRLHALSLTTGAEMFGGPSEITASFPTSSGSITFDPRQYLERSGLLLLNGTIYTAWTSHCDNKFYTGWVMAYSASTLKQTAVLNVAPNSGGVGPAIWMSGGGIAADSSGYLYLVTANGAFEQTLDASGFPNMGDFGDSFLKISTASGGLKVADYFSPSNNAYLANNDLDLGAGGILLLPDLADAGGTVRHLAVGAGKEGNIYVVNRDAMGHFSPTTNNNWQQLTGALQSVLGTPAYFNGAVYYCASGDLLRSFLLTQARLGSTPSSKSTATFPYPGCSPAVSANGGSNGIVWAHMDTTPAALYAYDASDLGKMLYNSNQAGGRDQLGTPVTFVTPTIADGKVFVQQANGVAVFGLL